MHELLGLQQPIPVARQPERKAVAVAVPQRDGERHARVADRRSAAALRDDCRRNRRGAAVPVGRFAHAEMAHHVVAKQEEADPLLFFASGAALGFGLPGFQGAADAPAGRRGGEAGFARDDSMIVKVESRFLYTESTASQLRRTHQKSFKEKAICYFCHTPLPIEGQSWPGPSATARSSNGSR
jgi:hypothetical protein